jgi:hypothetical protein
MSQQTKGKEEEYVKVPRSFLEELLQSLKDAKKQLLSY